VTQIGWVSTKSEFRVRVRVGYLRTRVKATRLQVPIDLGLHHLFSLPHRCTVESDEIYEAREKVRRHFSIRTGIGQKKTRKGFEEGAEHIGQFNFFVNARLLCTRVRGVG
jgi:hypothetical protein